VEWIGIHGTLNLLDEFILHWAFTKVHLKDETHEGVVVDGEVERLEFGDGVT
jgi:hypothetical protein